MLLALKEMILEKIIPIDYVKKGRKARLLAGLKNKKKVPLLLGYLIHYGLEKFYSSTHFQLMCN